jgi:tetratricopeptide (TPR) repeat protein
MTQRQFIIQGLLALLLLGTLAWQWRRRRYRHRVIRQMSERGERPVKPPRTLLQRLSLVLAIAAVLLMMWVEPKLKEALGPSWGKVAAWGGLFVVIFVGALVWVVLMRDSVADRAQRMARSGDFDGALAMMRRALDERPTAQRAAAMGAILSQAGRFAEAADAMARAEHLDPRKPTYSVGRVLMMARCGQAAAGLAHVERLRSESPQEGGLALAASMLLMELGRTDEAREQLRQGEELLNAFAMEQRVDPMTTSPLLKDLREKLGPTGDRAFVVTPRRAVPEMDAETATSPTGPAGPTT